MRSTIQIITCDRCSKEGDDTGSAYSLVIGGCVDASGNNGTEDISFDLCSTCESQLLHKFFKEKNRASGLESYIKMLVPNAQVYKG